jgi:hypothetical protein
MKATTKTSHTSGTVLIATERYTGKFLHKGVRCTVEPDQNKVRILDGPGKGRRVLADFSKLELFVDQEVAVERGPRFKEGDKLRILSPDQMSILGSDTRPGNYFYDGGNVEDYGGCLCIVSEVSDFIEERSCFNLEVQILEGDYEGDHFYILEDEVNEFYEKGKKYRISYIDADDKHHVKVIDAPTLEAAREKVGPIKQEFYFMSL